jgi:ribokinase
MTADPAGGASVVVVGSYNVGLTMTVPRFPTPGETVLGQSFSEGPGGKGSNQAIGVARLGGHAQFVGGVGDDQYGDDAFALWEREGVDVEHVSRTDETHTGLGFVIVNEDGENEITVAPGANERLDADDIGDAAGAVESADVLLCQLEVGDGPIRAAVEAASAAGADVVLNPAPARELPEAILSHVDYLTPNENEARLLLGLDPDDDRSDEAIATGLRELGVDTVVMTRGADGALVVTDDGVTAVPSVDVDVVDTTGAGDSFNAAFAVARGEGEPVVEAARFACAAGALAVTASEVIPGLPSREAVEAALGGD